MYQIAKPLLKSNRRTNETALQATWLLDESGATYKIEVSILKDVATLTIDTSGAGLHKRGYRQVQGEAPLKETLAAALVQISKWNPNRPLLTHSVALVPLHWKRRCLDKT